MAFRRDRRPHRGKVLRALKSGEVRYFLRTWGGLGDNIYLRPAARRLTELGDVWIETPWPEMYADLPRVHFVRPDVADRTYPTLDLRHARRNLEAQSRDWEEIPEDAMEVRPYVRADATNMPDGLLTGLRFRHAMPREAPLPRTGPWVFDLPDFGPPPVPPPYAVVRPAVLRQEWLAPARNPRPEYLANVAVQLQLRRLPVVSVADLQEGEEWIEPPEPVADIRFHHAELSVPELLSLIANADLVAGPVGFILPAALAARTPLLIIAGGHGRTECEEWLTAPWMDTSRSRWIYPDPFCRCARMDHRCPKDIPDFHTKAHAALEELLP